MHSDVAVAATTAREPEHDADDPRHRARHHNRAVERQWDQIDVLDI